MSDFSTFFDPLEVVRSIRNEDPNRFITPTIVRGKVSSVDLGNKVAAIWISGNAATVNAKFLDSVIPIANYEVYVLMVGNAPLIIGHIPTTGDVAWVAPTLLNGYTNFDTSTYNAAGYRRIGNAVFLRGMVTGGGTLTIFTLGTGYRPAKANILGGVTDSNNADIRVLADGTVYSPNAGSWVSLDGLSFFLD